MCGRYTIAKSRQVLGALLRREVSEDVIAPVYNASPGQRLPVILDREPERVVPALWGFRTDAGRLAGRLLINARAETVHDKPLFRDAFRRRRCLVIADGFYEWQKRADGKQPFRITLRDDRLFAFAGLWMTRNRAPVFLILTTDPNGVTGPIHDRMPVILEEREQASWLERELPTDEVRRLLDRHPEGEMTAYPVSRAVNDSRNEGPELIEPLAVQR